MKSVTQIGMQALFTTSLLAAPAVQAKKYTNVVIINLDDAGYGDFSYNGAYGYSTPHIDKLACTLGLTNCKPIPVTNE